MVGVCLRLFLWHAMRNSSLTPQISNARGVNVDDRCIFCRIPKLDSRDQIFIPCLLQMKYGKCCCFGPNNMAEFGLLGKKPSAILIIAKGIPFLANRDVVLDIAQLG